MNLPVPQLPNSQTKAATHRYGFSSAKTNVLGICEYLKITALVLAASSTVDERTFAGIPGLFPTNVTVLEPFHAGYTLVGNSD